MSSCTIVRRQSLFAFFTLFIFIQFSTARNVPIILRDVVQARDDAQSPQEDDTLGWYSPPNLRGTMDIIWSSIVTIFLCSWSVLCVQVPALGEDELVLFRRKFYLFLLAVAGPEFTLLLALGQWVAARRSYKAFRADRYDEWTMNHSFFADMGGFLLRSQDMPPFPIDSMQLYYLIKENHVDYPAFLDKRTIGDRNKTDTLVRVITVCQTLWFTINCIARAIQHLALTTLELTALAFIFCTLATTFCWAHKPADVERPIILESKTPIAKILIQAGDAASEPYRNTPLDFISRREWSWSLYWQFWRGCLRGLHVVFFPKVRPLNRFPNDNFPEPGPWGLLAFFFFSTGYAAIFLAGWNFPFPTYIEKKLWRIAALTSMANITVTWLVDTLVFRIFPGMKQKSFDKTTLSPTPTRTLSRKETAWFGQSVVGIKVHRMANWMRNSTLDRDSAYNVPLRALVPVTTCAIVYLITRTYFLVEDFAGLRSLPKSAYDTVDWLAFLPHI